eukprot:gene6350-9730_t
MAPAGAPADAATLPVGLGNKGATCYLNSLLQALFHLTAFRDALFRLPGDRDPVVLAMQMLFYSMETSRKPVATDALIASFGWATEECYTQHDVQELLQVLCDRIESCFRKHLPADNAIEKLFSGRFASYVHVTDSYVDYENEVEELFLDVQLIVRNHDGSANATLEQCLRAFCKEEALSGANRYELVRDGCRSLHDAVKGMRFKAAPPVLFLHLKRFRRDNEGRAEKLSSRLSYPRELSLAEYLIPAPPAGEPPPDYTLHAVLVHSGSTTGSGHYYTFVQLEDGTWCKFDDTCVTPCSEADAIAQNFGGGDGATGGDDDAEEKTGEAYMLVYVKTACRGAVVYRAGSREASLTRVLRAKQCEEAFRANPADVQKLHVLRVHELAAALSRAGRAAPLAGASVPELARGLGRGAHRFKESSLVDLKLTAADCLGAASADAFSVFLLAPAALTLLSEATVHGLPDDSVLLIHDQPVDARFEWFSLLLRFNADASLDFACVAPQMEAPHPELQGHVDRGKPVLYSLGGRAISGLSGNACVVFEGHLAPRYEAHVREVRSYVSITVPPALGSEHLATVTVRLRKKDKLTPVSVAAAVARCAGVSPAFVACVGSGKAGWRYDVLEFDAPAAKRVRSLKAAGKARAVAVFGGAEGGGEVFLGRHTLLFTGIPADGSFCKPPATASDLEAALSQLGEDVVGRVPDGPMLAVFVKKHVIKAVRFGDERIDDLPVDWAPRLQPFPRNKIGVRLDRRHWEKAAAVLLRCSFYDEATHRARGVPFVHVCNPKHASKDVLDEIRQQLGLAPWTTADQSTPPESQQASSDEIDAFTDSDGACSVHSISLETYTRPSRPIPNRNPAFRTPLPKSWEPGDDGSSWKLCILTVC